MSKHRPAEVFHPGEYIADELEARHWAISYLADRVYRSNAFVHRLIAGRERVDIRLAETLGDAFGVSPVTWMQLQKTYDYGAAEVVDNEVTEDHGDEAP